jgi:hypothetical protein
VYWGGSSVSRFINRLKIDDIIINEGISFWQIKSYMAILVKDEDKMVVIFEVKKKKKKKKKKSTQYIDILTKQLMIYIYDDLASFT